jgi:hypothetical protein
MTWGKATPVLAVAVVFDGLRLMFELFWFFGPAFSALICTVKASDVVGTTIGGALCTAGAGVVGFYASPMIAAFGVVMAMATGLIGWSVVGWWLMMTNARIFKENTLLFIASLAISEVPFVGSIPAISVAMWRMHHVQIKKETAAFKKWERENAEAQREERNRQVATAQLMQMRSAELASADV